MHGLGAGHGSSDAGRTCLSKHRTAIHAEVSAPRTAPHNTQAQIASPQVEVEAAALAKSRASRVLFEVRPKGSP